MRLSPRAVSVLCAIAIIAPLGAAAAGVITMRDLAAIVQSNKKPLAFDITAKGTSGKSTLSFNLTGTQNGDMKSLAKAAADVALSLDATLDATTAGHAKMLGIMVDKTLYLRLDEFTVTGEWAPYAAEITPYMKQWFSFPVDPAKYAEYLALQEKRRNTSTSDLEAYFSIAKEDLHNGGARYTVTIPKNKQRRLLTKLIGRSYGVRSPSMTFSFTVDTAQNVFDAVNSTFEIKAKVGKDTAKFTLTGKTSALKSVPSIAAPAGSTPWETFSKASL